MRGIWELLGQGAWWCPNYVLLVLVAVDVGTLIAA